MKTFLYSLLRWALAPIARYVEANFCLGVTGTSNFGELLWPGIRTLWGHRYDQWRPLYTQWATMTTSDKAFEKYQGVTSLGLAAQKPQGKSVSFADPLMGFQALVTNVSYALATSVTREMNDDDQYGYIRRLPSMLADAMRKTEETVMHNVLNNGFSSQLAADGVALFSTSHVTMDGDTTFANTPAVAADLTQTALENAEITIGNFKDERGQPAQFMGRMLVVPVDQMFTADKILDTKYEVDTANNTVNPIQGKYRRLVSPYITDTDSWFLITDAEEGLIFQRRTAAEMAKDGEFTTLNMRFSCFTRFGVASINPRCAYASPGA